MIYLVEMTAAIDSAGTTTVLRATTATHYATRSTDTPANTQYLPRVKTAGLFRRDLSSPGHIYGRTSVGFGLVELVNADGALDPWLEYGFDGRECRILAGEDGAAYADFVTVLRGTMDQIQCNGLASLSVRIRDRMHELDKPIQTTAYAGSNSLPAGVEGVEDIKGKLKPRAYGYPINVTPVMVNTSRLIYQVSDKALYLLPNVYDQGVALTAGADYSSQADMETTAPSAGQFRRWLAGGMFRLGSTPAGQITADPMEYNSSVGQTGGRAASLMNEIAQDVGIASGDISAADVAALNAAAVWPDLGLYLGLDDRLTALEAMDYLCTSVRAWYGFDRLGVLRMAQLTAPQEAAAAYRFQPAEILQVSRRPGDDAGAGVPAWAVKARYFRNWTVQSDSDLAGSVTAAQRQYKTQEWRNARYTDATIKNKHAQATEHEFDSAITTEGNMQTEALQRLNLLKGERSMYDVRVHLRLSMISVIELGAVVLVDFPRFGMTGRAFAIIGILHNPLGQTAELTLWG